MDAKQVGVRIAQFRKKAGLTQQQLADALFITNKAVSKWECGEGLPDIATLPMLAQTLSTSIDTILCGRDTQQEKSDTITLRPPLLLVYCAAFVLFLLFAYNPQDGLRSLIDPYNFVFVAGLSPILAYAVMKLRKSNTFLQNVLYAGLPIAGVLTFLWGLWQVLASGQWDVGHHVVFLSFVYAAWIGIVLYALHYARRRIGCKKDRQYNLNMR